MALFRVFSVVAFMFALGAALADDEATIEQFKREVVTLR